MTDDELLVHIEREEANCIVHYTGLLSEQRRKAMQYYYGQPYGNEIEGRSQIVTTEVKDAVEGIMPALMAIFTASGEIVRCEPKKPGDEDVAAQATDYLHYVFWEKNPGFLVLYSIIKDALLQKNGYCKAYWEKYEDVTKQSYEDLDDMEFQSLVNDDALELLEHTETPDEKAMQAIQQQVQQAMAQLQQMPPPQQQMMLAKIQQASQHKPMLHEAVFRKTKKHGKVCIDPLPPEEVLISRETPNELTKARFVEHRTLRTISDIREMGYDVPDEIADYAPNADFNLERVERLKYDDSLAYRQDNDNSDPSTKQVWLCEAYAKVDFDGDGIAELRKVTKVGKTVLDNVEFDSLPIIGGTAILMPHKHYGLSVFDLIGDLQLQSSTLLRNIFDNTYLQNNGRLAVLEGMVNMSDLLTVRPGGLVRMKAMNAIQPIPTQMLGQPAYNLLEYLNKIKQNRVGVTDFPNAVDADAINAKAAFVDAYKSAALERITLMARILAETVVKPIFLKLLELECKHQDKEIVTKLRGKWVPLNPREWEDRFSMSITVGLGTGSQQQTIQGAMTVFQAQMEMAKVGLSGRVVTEGNFFEAGKRLAKATFPKDWQSLFTDPKGLPPAKEQPNPDIMKLQQKEASDQRKMKQRYDQMQQNFILQMQKLAQDKGIALADLSLSAAEMSQGSAMQKRDLMHEHIQGERDRATQLASQHIEHGHEHVQNALQAEHQKTLQESMPDA